MFDQLGNALAGLGPVGLGLASAASPCLLPLYPGFVAYLAANSKALEGRRGTGLLGLIVLAGVLTMMTLIAIVLVIVAVPTSRLLAVATPVIDGLLILLGILLLAGRNPFERLPGATVPIVENPFGRAYVYGLFLGPIALPCAGPFLISLLGISLGVADATGKIGTFLTRTGSDGGSIVWRNMESWQNTARMRPSGDTRPSSGSGPSGWSSRPPASGVSASAR